MITLVALVPNANASPTDYYVNPDPNIGDDSNPGTFSQPFLTLTHAVDVAQPHDTIHLRGGIYHEAHEAHDVPYPPPVHKSSWECNLGYPEDFPIYLKQNLTIKAYESSPGNYEDVLLTTEGNCNEDILRIYIDGEDDGRWNQSSDAAQSRIIGVKFKTKDGGQWQFGSG